MYIINMHIHVYKSLSTCNSGTIPSPHRSLHYPDNYSKEHLIFI